MVGLPFKPYSEEAKLRLALNRAYYAVFCKAREYLYNKTSYLLSSDKETHWDVINQFSFGSNPVHTQIGRDLRRLFEYRKRADYEDEFSELSLDMARKAVILADRVMDRLNKLK